MKRQTTLARRNKWMRQLKRLRDERNRRVEDESEPEGRFRNKPVLTEIKKRYSIPR
jgi:hypothetical protein